MEKRCTWDNGSVWPKDRLCKIFVGQWPIFHGPLILPSIIVRLKLFLHIKKWCRLRVFMLLWALALVFLFHLLVKLCVDIIGSHVFSCTNICQFPRKLFKYEATGWVYKHLPKDPANVNVMKQHVWSPFLHFGMSGAVARSEVCSFGCDLTWSFSCHLNNANHGVHFFLVFLL